MKLFITNKRIRSEELEESRNKRPQDQCQSPIQFRCRYGFTDSLPIAILYQPPIFYQLPIKSEPPIKFKPPVKSNPNIKSEPQIQYQPQTQVQLNYGQHVQSQLPPQAPVNHDSLARHGYSLRQRPKHNYSSSHKSMPRSSLNKPIQFRNST